jgi:hypothetical protein
MKRNNSSISKASSYSEMGSYWDAHGLDECWDETSDASFEFVAEPQITYFAIEKSYPHPLFLSRIFRIFKGEEGGLSVAHSGSPESLLKIF